MHTHNDYTAFNIIRRLQQQTALTLPDCFLPISATYRFSAFVIDIISSAV